MFIERAEDIVCLEKNRILFIYRIMNIIYLENERYCLFRESAVLFIHRVKDIVHLENLDYCLYREPRTLLFRE